MDEEQRSPRRDAPHRKRSNNGKLFLVALSLVFVLATGGVLGFFTASMHAMPNLRGEFRPAASSQLYDSSGKLITTLHSVEDRIPVSIAKIPPHLQNAFIAVEDARFYQHFGIDFRGILRAIWSNLRNQEITEGGSTITQQLAKNAFLSQDRTLKRKLQELFLALQIERQYTKQEILELYLNQIYFGQGAYGVQAAATTYFGKNVQDLTLAECSILAGIPKSPNYYSPLNNPKAAQARQTVVLDQMVKYGYLSTADAAAAKAAPLKLATGGQRSIATYFVDYVTQYLINRYGADAVYKDGLQIYTSLDLSMQQAAEAAMQKLPTTRTENGIQQPQGALIALDPHTGFVKAMVGGRGTDHFNRATMAERQPGSAFKPFVFLAALEAGLSPSSTLEDSPITFNKWTPVNYDGKLHGMVTLRQALALSLNIPTVKLANQVGIDKALAFAQQLGISTLVTQGQVNDRNLAAALGGLTRGVTPLELASAYSVFANQGVRAEPVIIVRVVDRTGKILEEYTPREKPLLSDKTAYRLTDMLKGVISSGTGMAANIGRPAAGKTGTTSDYKDAWFVGYTPDLVAAVWMGHDAGGELNGITGGSIPAEIWRSFMTAALAKIPVRDFPIPSGLPPETSEPAKTPALKEDSKNDATKPRETPKEQPKNNPGSKQPAGAADTAPAKKANTN